MSGTFNSERSCAQKRIVENVHGTCTVRYLTLQKQKSQNQFNLTLLTQLFPEKLGLIIRFFTHFRLITFFHYELIKQFFEI